MIAAVRAFPDTRVVYGEVNAGMCLLFRIIALFSILFLVPAAHGAAEGKGKAMVHELTVNGAVRSYLVYQPSTAVEKGQPLMIVLHGGLGNAAYMRKMTGMDDIADSGRFITAYPEGTGGRSKALHNRRTWNAGRCCGQAVKQEVDDVLFIDKMIDDIHARYSIDTRRVYVTGMSNGAMMAYRLACEIPEKIAAIIPVSGTLAVDNCDRAKDVPVLHIHGDRDENVPFAGGMGNDSLANVAHRSVPDTMELITRPRQCASPEQKMLNDGVQATSYDCKDGAPVSLYVIKGGGHAWAGGHGRNNKASDGRYISASKLAWDFAKQFHKP